MDTISWNDFEKIDIRAGTIIEANDFPKARKPAYKLVIDFGKELGTKRSSAQISTNHRPVYKRRVIEPAGNSCCEFSSQTDR